MATDANIGLDIVGLAAPVVDLGMGLAGNARVPCTVLLQADSRNYSPATGGFATNGGADVAVDGFRYDESKTNDPTSASRLLLNPSDWPAGTRFPRIEDKVVIKGETWTIYYQEPVPADIVLKYRIRR